MLQEGDKSGMVILCGHRDHNTYQTIPPFPVPVHGGIICMVLISKLFGIVTILASIVDKFTACDGRIVNYKTLASDISRHKITAVIIESDETPSLISLWTGC